VSSRGITCLLRGAGLAEKAAEAIGIGAQLARPHQAPAGGLFDKDRPSSRAGSTERGWPDASIVVEISRRTQFDRLLVVALDMRKDAGSPQALTSTIAQYDPWP
jgi:hypothetical protein